MVADPCFLFHVHDDQRLGMRLADQLRVLYPLADILCIADGIDNKGFKRYAKSHQITYLVGERLKLRRHGGAWAERFLKFYLENSQAPYLIKLDADSYIWRKFESFPTADLFGAIRVNDRGIKVLRGGCAGYQRSTVETILDSKLLQEDEYRIESRYCYRRRSPRFKFPDEPEDWTLITSEDSQIGDIAEKLNLSMAEWDEVSGGIMFRETTPDNSDRRWAVTHPVR